MENIQIDITAEGKTTLATAGKYCDRNIDINVSVPGGIGVVPDYWKAHLAAKATEIDTALNAAGDNKSAFLWYADAHWGDNFRQSPMILKYLSKNTGIKKTFFGGDIAQKDSGEIEMLRAWQEMVKDIPNHHSVIGNHDNNLKAELPTAQDRAEFFFDPERTGDVVFGTDETNGRMYYYIDNHIENTRYICLSTGRMWAYADEIKWCVDALNSTPQGWHIVVISHLWLNNEYADDGTAVIITTPPNYAQVWLDIFDAYDYRLAGTTSIGSVAYDFASAKAKIEFIIGGHVHQDYDFVTAKGIPVILTECDSLLEREDDSTAIKGTTSENCVYAIISDYDAGLIKVINVGRGDTRSIVLPDEVVPEEPKPYTNHLAIAIDETGAIYNEIGYKPNVRINSSDVEVSATSWYMTGYIPAKKYDIVYLARMEYMDIAGDNDAPPRTQILFYDASFSRITLSANHTLSSPPSSDFYPVFGENGDMIQFRVPNWGDIAYIRLCCGCIDGNSIITVNEPIGGSSEGDDSGTVPPVTPTNKIPTAIGFDGAVLNADTTPGYAANVRYSSSSNQLSALTDTSATGLIACANDATIRMRNISTEQANNYDAVYIFNLNDTDGNGVYYNTRYTFAQMLGDPEFKTVVDENGTLIEFTLPGWQAKQTHIAICSQYIGSDSIITVDEPLE